MRRVLLFAALFLALAIGAWIGYVQWIGPRIPGDDTARGRREAATPWHQVVRSPAPEVREAPPPSLPEEAAPDAVVVGRILDRTLAPLAGVEVELLIPGLDGLRVRTEPDGSFRIPSIPGDRKATLILRGPVAPEPAPREIETGGARAIRLNWMVGLATSGAIRPESVLCMERGHALRISLRGATDFPDGTILVAALVHGQKTHARHEIECAGGRVDAEIEPEERGCFSDAYLLELTFDPRLQAPELIDRIPEERRKIEIVEVPVYVGDPESAARYDEELFRYYGEALREVWPIVVALELAAEISVGGAKDPAQRGEKLVRLRALAGAELFPEGRLDPKAWRAWIDERIRPAIDALEERHRIRCRGKYPEVENRLGLLLQDTRLLARIASILAYRASGRMEDPSDAYFSEVEPEGEQILALDRIRKTRQFVDRWLRERRATGSRG